MSIVGKLTLRHLKENKKRTIVTVFGVIVSVAMITAVTTSITSLLGMMSSVVSSSEGDWIGYYMNTDAKHIQTAKEFDNVDQVVVCKDVGNYITGSQVEEAGTNMLSIRAQQSESFDHVGVQIMEGTYPANGDEIIIQKRFLQANGMNLKVGDTITLSQIQRFYTDGKDDSVVRQFRAYDPETQRVDVVGKRQFKLVGTYYKYSSTEYQAITGLDASTIMAGETVDLYTTHKTLSRQAPEQVNSLAKQMGEYSSVSVHNDYLRYNGYIIGEEAIIIYGFASIIMVIIMIASVTLIYNAFAISMSERFRYLGMLASVGATKKQKRSTVYYEGAFIGAIGIPLGILAGLTGIGITFHFIGPMMDGMFVGFNDPATGMKMVVSFTGILASIVLSIITILISAYIPGKRASKTTPIDAIRGAKEVTASAKHLKTSKLTRKIFGCEGELALKNIKRNKKKYRVIVASLSISVLLFLSVTSFTTMLTKANSMGMSTEDFDISLRTGDEQYIQKTEDFVNTLEGVDHIEKIVVAYRYLIGEDAFFDEKANNLSLTDGSKGQTILIMGLEDEAFRAFCKENGIDPTPYFQTNAPAGILQNYISDYIRKDNQIIYREYAPLLNVKSGDMLRLEADLVYIGDDENEVYERNPENTPFEVQAAAVTTKQLYSRSSSDASCVLLIMPCSVVNASESLKQSKEYTINLYTDNYEELDDAISSYVYESGNSVSYYNSGLQRQNTNDLLLIINVFVYGFIALITLICLANIFNTIITGINLRRREFAMIKSVGMTPKGFNRMVAFESLFYGIKALIIGLPLSVAVHVLMWYSLGGMFEMSLFAGFNWWAYAIAVLAVFVIVSAALLYSVHKVRKDNIIETLKGEDN